MRAGTGVREPVGAGINKKMQPDRYNGRILQGRANRGRFDRSTVEQYLKSCASQRRRNSHQRALNGVPDGLVRGEGNRMRAMAMAWRQLNQQSLHILFG